MTQSRYIRARVVDFAGEFGADDEVKASRQKAARQRKITAKLRIARGLKRRINRLRSRKPKGYESRVEALKGKLKGVMLELKKLGWKPKKPKKARQPGEAVDETEELLEELPDEPTDGQEDPLPDEDVPEEVSGNWLDAHVGAEKKPNIFQRAGKLFKGQWSAHVPLGDAARIQTKPGQRAMVATVSPGLFIVQVVSDGAAKKIAGDNLGMLPLLLYPLVKQRVQQKLFTPPQPEAPPQPAAPAPAAAPVGCDACRSRG